MIYAFGHTESYLKGFEEARERGNPLKKIGKNPEYGGGGVFKTRREAEDHITCNAKYYQGGELAYSVFGVKADWEKDTELDPDPLHPFRRLLTTSELVDLTNQP